MTPRPKVLELRSSLRTLGLLGGLALAPAFGAPAAPPENTLATVFETKVICREPGKYLGQGSEYGLNSHGHPDVLKRVMEPDRYLGWGTVVETRDHELIVSFSGDRDTHVCPWGKTQIIRSPDQGKTWSEPRTITSTPLDDRDSGIIQTKAGTLVVSWFTSLAFAEPHWLTESGRYARHAEKVDAETREKWLGHWVRRSEDNGQTWGPPIRTTASAPHGPIQLHDGRLLYVGMARKGSGTVAAVDQSSDDGRSWKVIAEFADPTGLVEPHLVELASGKIIAMFRHEINGVTEHRILQSESADGGRTWTAVHDTGIRGYPPHLIQLRNGWVLVSYGFRLAPFGERACISRDEGKTWDVKNEIDLTNGPGPDLGYPSSVQLDDDSILTVYYQAEKIGVPTCLMSTHWRLK